jgi:pyrroloquinoline quinone biosynthesis protein B
MFSSYGTNQFLVNASPDLKFQMEAESALRPSMACARRNTPIAGIILTSADLDQVLGLLLLREFQPLTVYATALVRATLEANSFFRMLHRVPDQLTWVEILPHRQFAVGGEIVCTPIPLAGSLPYYAQSAPQLDLESHPGLESGLASHSASHSASHAPGQAHIGLIFESEGRRIAYTPALPEITNELCGIYNSCDTILVDGTFWSDAELSDAHDGAPLARSIGHIPMTGPDGTIALLQGVTRPEKVFVHINNTNPVLDPRSRERKLVEDAGWQIGNDGWDWS